MKGELNPLPSVEKLNEVFSYDPATNVLRGKSGRVVRGKQSEIDGKSYSTSRIKFKLRFEKEPVTQVIIKGNVPTECDMQ